jgi:hypothetical protein
MSGRQKTKARLFTLVVSCGIGSLAAPAVASPIKYQLSIPTATVQLGSQSFTNVGVTFTFIGDDANAFPGSTPSGIPGVPDLTYSAIYQGVASVTINGPGPAQQTAYFLPNQIVVSIDHANEGVGFGFVAGGVGPSGLDATKLEPIYPGAISDRAIFSGQTHTGWIGYDLTFAYAMNHTNIFGGEFHADGSVDIIAAVYACNQFNGSIYYVSCGAPAPVPTSLGSFTINTILEPTLTGMGTVVLGEFTATVGPALPPAPLPPTNLSVTPQ